MFVADPMSGGIGLFFVMLSAGFVLRLSGVNRALKLRDMIANKWH
jgi:hypothetical protein